MVVFILLFTIYSKKLLILIDAMGVAGAVTLTLAIALALGAEIVAEHGAEDKVLLRRQLVERTGDDEFDGLQALAPSEIHVHILLSGRLQDVGDALTLQPLNGQLTIFLFTREEHHLAHTLVEFVDVVHQHLERCSSLLTLDRAEAIFSLFSLIRNLDLRGNSHRSHFFFSVSYRVQRYGEKMKCAIPKTECLSIAHQRRTAKAD